MAVKQPFCNGRVIQCMRRCVVREINNYHNGNLICECHSGPDPESSIIFIDSGFRRNDGLGYIIAEVIICQELAGAASEAPTFLSPIANLLNT
jgi:hypothetical protein